MTMRNFLVKVTDHTTHIAAVCSASTHRIDNVYDFLDRQCRVQSEDTALVLAVALAGSKARDQQAARARLGDLPFKSITIRVNVATLDTRVEWVNDNDREVSIIKAAFGGGKDRA